MGEAVIKEIPAIMLSRYQITNVISGKNYKSHHDRRGDGEIREHFLCE